ncbi:MAG: phosphatase PAP2 family protein [Candidatus Eisenbacteria bacterium]|nr:phosphatase PAP2 family protein [Candidatus Eisenbacteria bacterium]
MRRLPESLREGARWRLLVLGLLVLYFIQIDNLMKVRPDHAFLSLLVVALVLGNARRFLLDWSPFIALWIAYDFMRGVVDDLAGKINIAAPYLLEQRLFAGLFGGQIPNFAWVELQQAHASAGWKKALDSFTSGLYAMHMAMPILLAWIFWNTLRDRRMFYRFMVSFSIVTWTSFATYFVYPAAPPWYVKDFGFVQPEPSFKGAGAGNLIAADRWIGIPLFESVYKHLNPNKFAAIPSLHSAFPLLILIFCLKRFGRRAWPVAIYPLGVWFSAVYLDHHYLIDIILAWVYVAVGTLLGERVIFPALFERGPMRRALADETVQGPRAPLAEATARG